MSTIYFKRSRPARAELDQDVAAIFATMPGGRPTNAQHVRVLLHWLDRPYTQVWEPTARLSWRQLAQHGRQYELLRQTFPVTGRTDWLGGRNRFLLQCVRYVAECLGRRRSVRRTWQALLWEWRWLKLQFS